MEKQICVCIEVLICSNVVFLVEVLLKIYLCFQEATLERDQEFWVLLCCEFEVHEQLTTLIKILQFLLALPKEKEDGKYIKSTLIQIRVHRILFFIYYY